jgi:hypothetical protein
LGAIGTSAQNERAAPAIAGAAARALMARAAAEAALAIIAGSCRTPESARSCAAAEEAQPPLDKKRPPVFGWRAVI